MASGNPALGDIIEQVYEAPLSADGWRSLVPSLEQSLGGGVAFFVHGPSSVSTIAACSSCSSELVDAYEDRLWTKDRAMSRLRTLPVGEVLLDSSLVSRGERLSSSFYNDYLGAMGNECGLYVPFLRQGEDIFVVSAQRGGRFGDFGDDEIGLLREVLPHLQRSFRTWQRLCAAEQEQAAALQALKHASLGLVLVDRTSRVCFANEAAEAKFRSGALPLIGGRVAGRGNHDGAALRGAIAAAAKPEGGRADTVQLESSAEHGALSLLVAPLPRDSDRATNEPLAMLMLGGDLAIPERSTLSRAYELTDAEARLLRALVGGERLADYSERAGVSITTVKSHLSSLFDKTGKRRQSELIRLALTDPVLRLQAAPQS